MFKTLILATMLSFTQNVSNPPLTFDSFPLLNVGGDLTSIYPEGFDILGFLKTETNSLVYEDDIYFIDGVKEGNFYFTCFLSPYGIGVTPFQGLVSKAPVYFNIVIGVDENITPDIGIVMATFSQKIVCYYSSSGVDDGIPSSFIRDMNLNDFLGLKHFSFDFKVNSAGGYYDLGLKIEGTTNNAFYQNNDSNVFADYNYALVPKAYFSNFNIYSYQSEFLNSNYHFNNPNYTKLHFSFKPDANTWMSGYTFGYSNGYTEGIISTGGGVNFWDGFTALFSGMGALLSISLFPGVTIGGIVILFVSIPLVFAIFKLIRGGD